MAYKCKVCDRFNTIEWESEDPSVGELQYMYNMLAALKIREEPMVVKRVTKTTTTGAKKPASEAQKKLMRQKSIPYDDDISAQEAFLLLQKYSDVYPNKNIP